MSDSLLLRTKHLLLPAKTDCDVTFSNHLITPETASASSTSMTLPVLRKRSRVKAHVQLTQCSTRVYKMKLDTAAQVSRAINDMSSDRMQEEEFLIHNYWLQSPPQHAATVGR